MVERGDIPTSRDKIQIQLAGFDSFESFVSYFNYHYLPALRRFLEDNDSWKGYDGHVLKFLAGDLVQMFADDEE